MKTGGQKKPVRILGISCFYHDAAAALLVDGVIVAAAQEERFTRKKHDESFPKNAVAYCLKASGVTIADIDHVVFYDKPLLKFERILETFFTVWPRGFKMFIMAMRTWLTEKLWIDAKIAKELGFEGEILYTEHHIAHAASAYYASPFDDAVVATIDGVGEWDTASVGYGKGAALTLSESIDFPDSLGLLYSALTYYLGFKVNSAEYKVMGLAPYGNPAVFRDTMKQLITVFPDGSFKLAHQYFAYTYGDRMTNTRFNQLFGAPARTPEEPLEQRHKDIAAALQELTEDIVMKIVAHARQLHPSENLCLAGGVALNCVANGKILQKGEFKNIYVQPASGDAGGAIGAACYIYYAVLGNKKQGSAMPSVYLGPSYKESEIQTALDEVEGRMDAPIVIERLADDALYGRVASLLAGDNVIGWFQGRMEFGPRSLGSRSILADARNKENWQRVNLKIKFRESFRPFAPSVLWEQAGEFFDLKGHESPHMLLVAPVLTDSVPAVTHVDRSARVQTVKEADHGPYYRLLQAFFKETGCPVIINTSFNVRSEPIVESPKDALFCFMNTDMDYLVLENYIIGKAENPGLAKLRDTDAYIQKHELD